MPTLTKRKAATAKSIDLQASTTAKRADAKGRVTLGAEAVGKEFDVTRNEAGQFILTPMVRIPEREAWIYQNPEVLALLQAGFADLAAGRVTEPQDFSHYADLDIDE